LVVKLT